MPQEIIDLDELLAPPKRTRIAGKVYQLPGDIPADLFLYLQGAAAAGRTDLELAQYLNDRLLELFQEHQPDMTELPRLTLSQLYGLVMRVYTDQPTEKAARPTRAARAGTPSTKSKPPARRR